MRKRLMAGLVAGALMAAIVPGVASASNTKADLFGEWALYCDTGQGHLGAPIEDGFANINFTKAKVNAVISLKGRLPDAEYRVILVQSSDDCFTVDGTLTTNGQGNGNLRLSELRAGSVAFVQIISSDESDRAVSEPVQAP
jgi:hypothetical protein